MPNLAHVNYPHNPGTLWDCLACESACYCRSDGQECVYCASLADSDYLTEKERQYINRFSFL